jgi:hypothetical protein
MSQSITVIGGNQSVSGLVTVPLDIQASIASSLQSLLGMSGDSGSIVSGSLAVTNVNAIAMGLSGNFTIPANTASVSGIAELTNTNSNGSVFGGASVTGYTTRVPDNYSVLIDELPGSGVIRGNSSQNFLGVFGKYANATFVPGGGSGTLVAGGSGDLFATTGTWSIDGSTDGGDTINGNGSVTVNTYGIGGAGTNNAYTLGAGSTASNTVGVLGGAATVNSYGQADLIEGYSQSTDIVSIHGSAVVLVGGGAMTVYAAAGSSSVASFFNTGGTLYFVNQTANYAEVTGDVSGATGGSATIFGGAGGGYYVGGTGGSNSIIGGYAPGQASTGSAGLVTLQGNGPGNFLEATGSVAGSNVSSIRTVGSYVTGGNVLIAGNSNATLVASGTTSVNTFDARGASQVSVSSSGAGAQTYYLINKAGTETITGSTVSGASNTYYLTESNTDSLGGNTDVLTNFKLGTNILTVSGGGATIINISSITGGSTVAGAPIPGGTAVSLSDGTVIKLVGVTYNASTFNPYIGKSSI